MYLSAAVLRGGLLFDDMAASQMVESYNPSHWLDPSQCGTIQEHIAAGLPKRLSLKLVGCYHRL
jgi:hypothetical protein